MNIIKVFYFFVSFFYSLKNIQTSSRETIISIIHFNDFHARYEPITNIGSSCLNSTACLGGFSRLYFQIQTLINENPNSSIVLNAGDNFKGTLWYFIYKWKVTAYFFNKIPQDAMVIGNHEFNDGIENLLQFLKHIKIPVVCSNIDNSEEPTLKGFFNKSVIIHREGKKFGIIGILTTKTKILASVGTGKLKFLDESSSVNIEAEKLVNEEDIFTNIVLSHCGYETDLEIARKSHSKISVIVGGHTNTFLYTGENLPGPDKPSGPYPTIVTNTFGEKVLVVQASAYTKYLGNLSVVYDELGKLLNWSGNPIYLDHKIPQDGDINAELKLWKQKIDENGTNILGSTDSTMPNTPCRHEECLLGNFATDAMIYYYVNGNNVSSPLIAMTHAGGLRAGLEKGNITFEMLSAVFPFEENICSGKMKGAHIREILESSIDEQHLISPHFYQLSGLKVHFNVSKPEGSRVQSLKVRSNYLSLEFEDIAPESIYDVVIPSFLIDTGFNPLFAKFISNKTMVDQDLNVYLYYLKHKSNITTKIENRIIVLT